MRWSRPVAILAVLVATLPVGAQQTPRTGATQPTKPAGGAPTDQAHYALHWAQLVDQYGFAQPMEVSRFLIPVDWNFSGVVNWTAGRGCPPNMVSIGGRASSADSTSGFLFFPSRQWQWFDDPQKQQLAARTGGQSSLQTGCPIAPLMGAVDYIRREVLPGYRPNARVVTTEPMPKLAQALQSEAQANAAGMIQQRLITWVRVDAGRVKIAYEINGRPVEEWIMATVKCVAKPGMRTGLWYNLTASRVFAYRTPAGKLESQPALFGTILGSITNNPNWTAKETQMMQGATRTEQKGVADRNQIRAGMQANQTNAIIQHGRDISASEDQQAAEFAQTERGLQWYTDPNTHQQVEMTYGYRHSFTNGNGEYILNDDPNFNPSKVYSGTWTELEPQQ